MRPCRTSGCPSTVTSPHAYCSRCQQARDRQRPTRTARGYDNRWLRYSARRLQQDPFCALCGRLAEVTDHIVSARHAPQHFWDPDNHQSLCGDCNRRKAIAEEGGFGGRPRST